MKKFKENKKNQRLLQQTLANGKQNIKRDTLIPKKEKLLFELLPGVWVAPKGKSGKSK